MRNRTPFLENSGEPSNWKDQQLSAYLHHNIAPKQPVSSCLLKDLRLPKFHDIQCLKDKGNEILNQPLPRVPYDVRLVRPVLRRMRYYSDASADSKPPNRRI